MIREPAVSGQFYPATQVLIKKQIDSFLPKGRIEKSKAIAIISPHAGYIYSGEVAASVISSVLIPKNIILLGPNHTGFGSPLSIMAKGTWKTPLGNVLINEKIAKQLLANCNILSDDSSAHTYEHCLEVQLPILQYFSQDFEIVPIVVSEIGLKEIYKLSEDIARLIKGAKLEKDTLILASTDMTHYEPEEEARRKDDLAIEKILELNSEGLLETVSKNSISMCGIYPTAIAIEIARKLGAKEAKLIKYETSAKTSSDYSTVVGYAGIVIKE
ncbi:MAG: AmmeMemoRadiSam system protein B [Candidatus Omnitrophota bacterium]